MGTLFPRSLFAAETATGFRELRDQVGIFWGHGGTIGWLISDDAVVVVDSQFVETAKIFVDGLRQRSEHGVDVLINTHHHTDHTSGNSVFRNLAERIIAHRNVPSLQKARAKENKTLADQVYARETFSKTWSATLGKHTIEAEHFGRAHTSGDAVVHFPEANVVHVGDLVFNRWHPLIDAPSGGSVRGWLSTLEKIHERFDKDTLFIFGHGAPSAGRTGRLPDIALHRDYFAALLEHADRSLRGGSSRDECRSLEQLKGFEDFASVGERFSLSWCLGVAWDELKQTR